MEGTEQLGNIRIGFFIIVIACGFILIHPAGATDAGGTAAVTILGTAASSPAESAVGPVHVVDLNMTQQEVRIGPSHVLYGLKVSLEDFDLSFTPAPEERIEKQLENAQMRIAEVKTELASNRVTGAETALSRYREKMNAATTAVSSLPPDGHRLLAAQEAAAEQQVILSGLIATYKDNPDLQNAYTGNVELGSAFAGKTGQTIEGQVLPDNRVVLLAVKVTAGPVPARTGAANTTVSSPGMTGTPAPAVTARQTVPPTVQPTPTPQNTPPALQPGQTNTTPTPQVTVKPVTPAVTTTTPAPAGTAAPTQQPTVSPATPAPSATPSGKGSNTGGSGTGGNK